MLQSTGSRGQQASSCEDDVRAYVQAHEGGAPQAVLSQRAALAAALLAQPHGHKGTEHWCGAAMRPFLIGVKVSHPLHASTYPNSPAARI